MLRMKDVNVILNSSVLIGHPDLAHFFGSNCVMKEDVFVAQNDSPLMAIKRWLKGSL